MRENKVLLNEEKTEFLLMGTKQQLAKVDIGHIKVGKVNIAPHSLVKTLNSGSTQTYLWLILSPRLVLQRLTIFITLEELENI